MTTTNRTPSATPQDSVFDPDVHDDPVRELTALIRGLRLGQRVRMPDGSLVLSRTVQVGPHQERRFTVMPPVDKSSPVERHRAIALGYGACKTAEEAANKAIKEAR